MNNTQQFVLLNLRTLFEDKALVMQMEKQKRTDLRWSVYVILLIIYCTQVIHDWISALIFLFILIYYSGIIHQKLITFLIQLTLSLEIAIKIPNPYFDPSRYRLDVNCINGILHTQIRPDVCLFLLLNTMALYMTFRACCRSRQQTEMKRWGPLMTQVMVYILPVLMYSLSLASEEKALEIGWASIACLQILNIFPKVNHLFCCLLITYFVYLNPLSPQYNISSLSLSPEETSNTIRILLLFMVILINVYSRPDPNYKQQNQKEQGRLSIKRKVILRRQVAEEHSENRWRSKMVLALTVGVCLVTTAPGNIFLLLAVFWNMPVYKAKRFCFLMGFGLILCFIMEPSQIAYFIYLYVVVLVVGQNIKGSEDIQYDLYSYGLFLDFYRLYLMLSHVSFINFLMGLCRSSAIVLLALVIRIFCRYFSISSVFMGTNDNYGFTSYTFDLQALPDGVLWGYMLLLKLYSQRVTYTYTSSTITNILLEYPFLRKIQPALIILRIFNWVSYILFSLLILSRLPSLFIIIHIAFLVVIVLVDTMASKSNMNKETALRWLWLINFYVTIGMVFIKYFYFLKMYDNTSSVITGMLEFLTKHHRLIGLDSIDENTSAGFSLFKHFGYQGAIIIISWINSYMGEFKVYEEFRKAVMSSENITELQQNLLDPSRHEFSEEQMRQIQVRSIRYFYSSYIKPPDIETYLANKEFKFMEKLLNDCFFDFTFALIVIAFSLEPHRIRFVLYFPIFMFMVHGYYLRFTRGLTLELTKKVLTSCLGWSLIVLLTLYIQITINQLSQEESPSALSEMFVTYTFTVSLCLFYKLVYSFPEREHVHQSPHFIISVLLPFKIKSIVMWEQILAIFSDIWFSITLSLFFVNIFSPHFISTILHPLAIILVSCKGLHKHPPQHWLYITAIVSLFDIWGEDFTSFLTVIGCVICYASWDAHSKLMHGNEGEAGNSEKEKQKQREEQSQMQEKDLTDAWLYYHSYCTIIWLLPSVIALVWLMGVVWLSPSLSATLLIVFSLSTILYQLLFQSQVEISQPIFILTVAITMIFFIYQLTIYLLSLFYTSPLLESHSTVGLFLIFSSSFFYLILSKKSVWYIKRGNHAKEYWEEKTIIVGELGSQLHNEKKLISLQAHFSNKQKLADRVDKISRHLRKNNMSRETETYLSSFDTIMFNVEESHHDYELSSNMLLFLPNDLLSKCFIMLNQYIPQSLAQDINNVNIFSHSRLFREEVLRTYTRSFLEAITRVKNENQLFQGEGEDDEEGDSEESKINLERVYEINLRYKRCYEILSEHTSQFSWAFRLIFQNFEILSMMVVVGWNLFGGVYSIPANIVVFAWAVVLENKTTVVFWIFLMSYVCFILIVKQILPYLPVYDLITFIFYYHPTDYLYEYLIVLVSTVQIVLIKLGGTKDSSYSEKQSIYDCFYRAALNRAANKFDMQREQQFMKIYRNLRQPKKHTFIYRVFSKSRFKPGKDFYPLMSGIQLVILLYIFFFYDMMEFQSMKNHRSIGELLSVSQFSSHMVIALFLQVMIMIIDRLIVSLNFVDEANKTLENFFLSFTFSIGQVKHDPPEELDKIGVFDFLLVLKYVFHLTLLILVNLFIYVYVPSAGLTKSLIPSCTELQCNKSYTYLSAFLILYFLYFFVSGLQIKHGFSRNKCKNVLMEKHHYINYYFYKAFTAIPFAWEFKKICDWTVTSTALPLFHWMKFEDINARMYESKCEAEMIKLKPLGTPWNKYILGPAGFLSILLLVFSPFLIYSPVNPFSVSDSVIGAQLNLYLRMDNKNDYKFFSTSHTSVIENIENQFQIDMTDRNLFLMRMSKFPDENFLFSEPTVLKLSERVRKSRLGIKHRFQFVLALTVIEKEGGESIIQWSKKTLNQTELLRLEHLLTLKRKSIQIADFYSPFPGELPLETFRLQTLSGQYYELEILKKDKEDHGLYFYYLTTNKFKLAFGIVTFYLTYVLVISRLLRFYLTGTIRNVIYEGCYLEGLLVLCEAVREARIVEQFQKEESFYFELVDLMRYPKMVKKITGDFVNFRKKYI